MKRVRRGESLTSAAQLIAALGGNPATGMCRCPAHNDNKKPNLHVTDSNGKVLVHCFAGCTQEAVLAALNARGLWRLGRDGLRAAPPPIPSGPLIRDAVLAERRRKALYFWEHSQPIERTLAERYLREHRAIEGTLPRTLRFLKRFSPGWPQPCLVAALQDDEGYVNAVQLTFLDRETAQKANLKLQRKTFGAMGRCAVRLGPAKRILGLAEGVETGLSASQLFEIPVWATLGAERLGAIAIPGKVRRVHIFADNGSTGRRCARDAAHTYAEQGFKVSISRPKRCSDFNDLIRLGDGE